jgi:hypothetical protein
LIVLLASSVAVMVMRVDLASSLLWCSLQVAGLQVLSELLKFGFNLLQPSLAILSALRS